MKDLSRFDTGLLFLLAAVPCLVWPSASLCRPSPEDSESFGRGPHSVYATIEPHIFSHNIGLLSLQITNLGILGNPWIDAVSAGWRGAECLYQASLWVGALDEEGEPRVSSSVYSPSGGNLEFRPSLLEGDTIYESYEGIHGGNRPGIRSADDDLDGLVDEDFHNGLDDDGDGSVDEDFSAIGQQMFSCEYRDNTNEAVSQSTSHVPLGLKVRQRSFQWSADDINEFVGFDFKVMNIGDQRLRNIYIGFHVDGDIGPVAADKFWIDDLVGYTRIDTMVSRGKRTGQCDKDSLSMDIAYFWDSQDDDDSGSHGDTPGYFGTMFLGHSVDPTGVRAPVRVGLATVRWTSQQGAYPLGDPQTDFEAYDLLSSRGSPPRNAIIPNDYRFTLSAGPFSQLDPGAELSFQTAFVVGNGREGMILNAINSQLVFNGLYIDADMNPATGVRGRERCLTILEPPGIIFWDDPCDTLTTRIQFRFPPFRGCVYVDDDCNPCTGVNGAEAVLNWVGKTAPPTPSTNTDAGISEERIRSPESNIYAEAPGRDRQVFLQWDNLSELIPDPLTGEDIFEGYRIWRVNNWYRPEGSLGPAPNEWMLIAEFRKTPRSHDKACPGEALRCITRMDRSEIREMTANGPRYHVGRYEWMDTSGIINGRVYFYAVTAFGVVTVVDATTGLPEQLEISSRPGAVQKEVIVASWVPGQDCRNVSVVPNPYRGGADWDLNPSDCDPTGTKIAFRNLPREWEKINIFSVAGDLVFSGVPADSRAIGSCFAPYAGDPRGTFFWDLITRSGQDIAAGIYLYVVEKGGESCRGRFVIIR